MQHGRARQSLMLQLAYFYY